MFTEHARLLYAVRDFLRTQVSPTTPFEVAVATQAATPYGVLDLIAGETTWGSAEGMDVSVVPVQVSSVGRDVRQALALAGRVREVLSPDGGRPPIDMGTWGALVRVRWASTGGALPSGTLVTVAERYDLEVARP